MATPMIDRLIAQGLTKSEILDRINGPNNGNILTREQLNAIGFRDTFIQNYLRAKGVTGGGGGGGGSDFGNFFGYDWRSSSVPKTPGGTGTPNPVPVPNQPPGGPVPGQEAVNVESAYKAFSNYLRFLGIPTGADIEQIIRQAVVDGFGPEDIQLVLADIQDTQTWRNRFPGWHARLANGFNQISVQEYLGLENTYKRTLMAAGLPAGFYDSAADFGQWIAANVSPQEIQDRVDIAMDAVRQVDPTARDLLTQFYGVTSGDLASYFLDQKRALPVLDRQFKAVNVAQWAKRNGLKVRDAKFYEGLIDAGITEDMAREGFTAVRTLTDTFGNVGDIYGVGFDQEDAEQDVFFNQSDKRRRLVAMEASTFGGSSSGSTGSARRGTSF